MENINSNFTIILVLLIDISISYLFYKIAKKKGYPGVPWAVIGFFIPILYIIMLLLPYRIENNNKSLINCTNNSKKEKTKNIMT